MSTHVKCPAPRHPSALSLLPESVVPQRDFTVTAESRTTVPGSPRRACQRTAADPSDATPQPHRPSGSEGPGLRQEEEEMFAVTAAHRAGSKIRSRQGAAPSLPRPRSSLLPVVGQLLNGRLQLGAAP